MNLKKYYSSRGKYLKEHKNYFSEEQLQKDVNFLIDVLNLKKKDKILDLACGHGRHTIELKKRGFDIDGLDFSGHLLNVAKEKSKQERLQINFYNQDIHNINLKVKYDKIFLFFSEFGLFDANKVLKNVSKILKINGLFLLDCDNVFRLIQYLIKHPKAPYNFDFNNMELKEKQKNSPNIRYYVVPELKNFFQNNGFKVIIAYGDYKKNGLDINSKRIILVGKKIKNSSK
ncbi:MAG: methyltransferase domain-containing protein [Patescibacteria group bacterium]|nr:methyltransferase domain-containing protein [Patescibacteria group bacterium]